ncbi:aspartyl-phosphate phosphatase Spo0E family protein [Bacillus sp. EB600]|uniref:aspartyl-phosphate phosphatase Spo0E family protein n=1 Tax=Bacillus sp. EB600 TaxID=2806345 RepID=UPI00210C69D8|nr:aspartyl-phosphate phosphatase Spo0E family protein [Bacillus sp. EB600]MCQ6280491.1 aspartyl-phosphate phosphatase Spo0E family protein [Bacillus sp. EB600]
MADSLLQIEKILERIKEKKIELQKLVSINGFNNPTVLRCSEELDKLIYQFQLIDHSLSSYEMEQF